MAQADELVCQERYDPFSAPVELRWDAFTQRRDLGNSHVRRFPWARRAATATHRGQAVRKFCACYRTDGLAGQVPGTSRIDVTSNSAKSTRSRPIARSLGVV